MMVWPYLYILNVCISANPNGECINWTDIQSTCHGEREDQKMHNMMRHNAHSCMVSHTHTQDRTAEHTKPQRKDSKANM